MSRFTFATRLLSIAAASTVAACSGQTPVEPGSVRVGAAVAAKPSPAPPGSYELRFFNGSGVEVTSLPVLNWLFLRAYVTDSSGRPAQIGSVTLEYCSYRGLPTNDITRPDEAPMSECAIGVARWRALSTTPVNQLGYTSTDFGLVRIPRTVGFRFQYKFGKNLIANGQSAPRDFTWTAQ